MLWLEADAIIRERSDGRNSLDDFCRKFLGADISTAKVVPYELPEIVEILRGLADFDWESFLARTCGTTAESAYRSTSLAGAATVSGTRLSRPGNRRFTGAMVWTVAWWRGTRLA